MYRTLYSATWAQALKSTNCTNRKNLAGVEGLFGPAGLTPSGPPFGRYPSSAHSSSRTNFQSTNRSNRQIMAGVEGFEPPYGGIKTRCLTAWRHPNGINNQRTRPSRFSAGRQSFKQGRVVQSARQKSLQRRRQLAHDVQSTLNRLDGQENTRPGSRQARGTILRQPVERARHFGISAPHHAQAVVSSTGPQEAVNCDGRGISCQFRILKYFRGAHTDVRL